MPEAHDKPRHMLETLKAQDATKETIPADEAMAEIGNQQVTQVELGWLAGIIDGEGYVGITSYKTRRRHPSYSCAIQISNTDEAIIIRAQGIIQKMGVNPYIRMHGYGFKNMPKSKTVWILIVHRLNTVRKVLEQIVPFLTGTKKERASLVQEYCILRLKSYVPGSHHNIISAREMEIVELCITKQKRGTSETTREAQLKNSELNRQKEESRRNRSNGRYSSYKVAMI